jgi:hypothetical protein
VTGPPVRPKLQRPLGAALLNPGYWRTADGRWVLQRGPDGWAISPSVWAGPQANRLTFSVPERCEQDRRWLADQGLDVTFPTRRDALAALALALAQRAQTGEWVLQSCEDGWTVVPDAGIAAEQRRTAQRWLAEHGLDAMFASRRAAADALTAALEQDTGR